MAFDEFAITEVEREICRLPAVSLARVVADSNGQVIQAHLVVLPGTNPQQIVRGGNSMIVGSIESPFEARTLGHDRYAGVIPGVIFGGSITPPRTPSHSALRSRLSMRA
jgi:hypothetical protein